MLNPVIGFFPNRTIAFLHGHDRQAENRCRSTGLCDDRAGGALVAAKPDHLIRL